MTAVAMQSFGFDDQLVRAVDRDGVAWFVANDVCGAVGIANARDAVAKLDDDERDCVGLTDAIGRERETTIISEGAVYTLVLRCRDAMKPGTLPYRFRKWVTAVVLPSLRCRGEYRLPSSIEDEPAPSPPLSMTMETPDQFEALRMKLRTVEAARMAFGAIGARRAWRMAGLPDLSDPEAAAPPALAVIAALHRSLSEWLEQRTEHSSGHREQTQVLYADYVGWARSEGYAAAEILSLSAFGRALTRCGVESVRSGRMHRVGLRLAI
ncbi:MULTISPECIES: BRO-N domain-containing protein [Sphingomonas]|uniref:BRO-N domain-containing protein n=1 Tax=Sphingomonas TaxID=13687 RepID=UPI00254E1A2B|nr:MULTISPECIES: BRO family protein [Sphingomonas]MDK8186725.1 BRO family protein [Sphingomonas zeae]MDK8216390.1 BRO family protein [Sphingomonas sp. UMB7805-LC452B]